MPAFKPKPPANNEIKINLLPRDPFYDSVIGKGTTWALSVGRYIVIFTELVVIISFASRFTLDRRVTDLNQEILEKQSIIESYGDLEQNVRDVQKRLEVYNQMKMKNDFSEIFDILTSLTPSDVTFKELTITNQSVAFSGRTQSTDSLTQFLNRVKTSPYFREVDVENISNKDPRNPGLEFRVKATIVDLE